MDLVRAQLEVKAGIDEVEWTAREKATGPRKFAAQTLASRQSEKRWKAWVLARLGGERGIDIARSLDYKDGSAITHMLKRLQSEIAEIPVLARP